MFSFRHAVWLAGFRPFFILACLSGITLPLIWAGIFNGQLTLTVSPLDPLRWHAHEMFFGFGWAVLGGFLLTSTKNWVNVRGYHGAALAMLTLAWLLERLAISFGAPLPGIIFKIASMLFLGCIAAMLAWTLIRYRARDSYRDNLFFIAMLPLFLVAKLQMLYGDFATGTTMSLALFRLAFLLMLERTLTQFMRGAFQVEILRQPGLDLTIKALGLLLVFEFAWSATLTVMLSCALGAMLLIRLAFWKPQCAFRRIDIGIMFIGYLAITAQLLLAALVRLELLTPLGSSATHLFTFGAMGCVIPAMIIRIAKGHTGRKVVFDPVDRGLLWLSLLALALRVGLPQLAPDFYPHWIEAAAVVWSAVFALLAWRYVPFLWRPRIDGREH